MTFRRGGWWPLALALIWALGLGASPAWAQAGFSPNQIVVWRVGGDASFNPGASALTNAATETFLDQFNPVTAGQTLPSFTVSLPTTVGTLAQTDSGTATSNGYFTRSQNSFNLITPGYNAALGTAGVAGSSPATITRSIGVVTQLGSVNSTTGFNTGPNNNYRSAAGDGSNNFWVSTAGAGGATPTPGIQYISNSDFGTVTAGTTIINGNVRNLRIFNNTLYATSGSATPGVGLSLIGSVGTLPTAADTNTVLPGTGTSGSSTPSPYGFWLFNNPLNGNNWNGTGFNTLYLADDRSVANGGGLQRWVFDGTTWALTATATYVNGTSSTGGFRGLAAAIDTTGQPTVTLWLTTINGATGGGGNELVTVSDVLSAGSGAFSTFTSLATAPANTAFRGVDFAPVPEPGTIALAGCCGVGFGVRRWLKGKRKRRKAAR